MTEVWFCAIVFGSGTVVLAYTTPTKTPTSTTRPATTAAAIVSRRRRRCFFVRPPFGPRPFPAPLGGRLPGGRPPGGRPPPEPPPEPPPGGRPVPEPPPVRDAVVRARPPPAGRRAPLPPPAPVRARAGGGRRTEPARGATGEVSSWGGTRG